MKKKMTRRKFLKTFLLGMFSMIALTTGIKVTEKNTFGEDTVSKYPARHYRKLAG